MRDQHELSKGVVCERCKTVQQKGEYKRINVIEPILSDSTGLCTTIDRLNLCNKCYEHYKNIVNMYLSKLI